MKQYKTPISRRFLCFAMTFVMLLAIYPAGALAQGKGWDEALASKERTDMLADVVEYAASQLPSGEDALAFTITGYAEPNGITLSDDAYQSGGPFAPELLPQGTLSVTITDGEAEDENAPPPAPQTIQLPAGTYTVELADQDGPEIQGLSGDTLTIKADETTELTYAVAGKQPVPVQPDLNDYITEMTLSVNGGEKVPVNEVPPLKIGDSIKVECAFSIEEPYVNGFRNDVPYTIPLPTGMDFDVGATASTDEVKLELDTANKKATLTFQVEDFENSFNVSGSFSYSGSVQPGEGDKELSFTVKGKEIKIEIVRPVPNAKVAKTGERVQHANYALVRWTVTVTAPEQQFPAGLLISDTMSCQGKPFHELREIERVTIGEAVLKEEDYTLQRTEQGFEMTLNQDFLGETMTIVFTSRLSQAGLKTLFENKKENPGATYTRKVDNQVTVTQPAGETEENIWGEATHSVSNARVTMLEKTFQEKTTGEDGRPYQTWRIYANKSFMLLPAGTVFTDTPADGLEFVSVKAYLYTGYNPEEHSYVDAGHFDHYTLVENLEDLVAVNSEAKPVTFTLKKEVDVPIIFVVETRQVEQTGAYTLQNSAAIKVGEYTLTASAGSGTQPGTYIHKTGNGELYDLTLRVAAWNVYFGNTPNAATITDTMEKKDGKFTQDLIAASSELRASLPTDRPYDYQKIALQRMSFKNLSEVPGGNGKVLDQVCFDLVNGAEDIELNGVKFHVSYDPVSRTLTVAADRALDGVYRIQYYTSVSNDVIYGKLKVRPSGGPFTSRKITNTATITIGDKSYSASAEKDQQNRNFDKGLDKSVNKNGYDKDTQTITWLLTANTKSLQYQKDTFQIIDRLPKGLEFAQENGEYLITLTTTGGEPLAKHGYHGEYSFNKENNELTISIKADDDNQDRIFELPVTAKIVTHVTDEGMDQIFQKGSAGHTFKNWGYQKGNDLGGEERWDGDYEELKLVGVAASKTAVYDQDTASINWGIQINPNHYAVISAGERLEITDQLSVTGVSGEFQPSDLVSLDSLNLVVTQVPQQGQEEPLKMYLAPEGEIPNTGNYYSYNAATLTLKLYLDTTGANSTDKYQLSYSTPLTVPSGYDGSETIAVENGVNWSGYKSEATIKNIKLAEIRVTIAKQSYSKIIVTKTAAEEPNKLLEGAVFALYRVEGENRTPVGQMTTKPDGTATFGRLKMGKYQLVELKAPNGYAISSQAGAGIDVDIQKQGDTAEVAVTNALARGNIEILKVDAADDTKLLAGAKFTLYQLGSDQPYVGVTNPAETGADGIARFEDLPAGRYVVKETEPPHGYTISKEAAMGIDATITTEGQTVKLEAKNTQIRGGIQITKVDAADKKTPLPGAEFTLYQKDGTTKYHQDGLVNPATTGSSGVVTFANLPVGEYVVKETGAPAGYEISAESTNEIQATITKDTEGFVSARAENTRIYGSIEILKVDAADQKTPLKGAEFTLYLKDGKTEYHQDGLENPAVTNENGVVTFANLPANTTYVVKEIDAPAGYEISAEAGSGIGVKVEKNKTEQLTVENTRIRGGIEILKVDAADKKTPLKGAEFTLYQAGSDQPYRTATTNGNGVATFADLPIGSYVVKETNAPAGYAISEVAGNGLTVNVEKDKTEPLTVENTQIRGNIRITKVDADNQSKLLPGAEFMLYQKDGKTEYHQAGLENPAKTKDNGIVTFANLPAGDYVVKEIKAPTGYTVSPETSNGIEATIATNGETVDRLAQNVRIYGGIEITKVDATVTSKLLSGAEFTLYQAGSDKPYEPEGLVNPAVTDSNGIAVFANLPAGDYVVKETKAPEGYEISASASNGIEMTIARPEQIIRETVTNARIYGNIQITKVDAVDGISPLSGAEFTLYQKDSDQPYQQDGLTNPVVTDSSGIAKFANLPAGSYEVKENRAPAGYVASASGGIEAVITQQGETFERKVENTKIYGGIELTKVDAASQTALPGAEFTLYAQGSNQPYQQEGLLNPAVTDSDGKAVFANLPAGDYVVKETKAPAGYEISGSASEGIDLTITQPGETIRERVTNARIYGNIQITKVDAVDGTTPLSGAEFTLYQKDSDQPYQQAGLTNPVVTDSSGIAQFANLPAGNYEVKETQAPAGYAVSAAGDIQVSITQQGETFERKVENTKIYGGIELTKVDAASQTPLPGAQFTLYAQGSDLPYRQDGLANPVETNSNGIAVFANLPAGDYVVKETKAPAGYEISARASVGINLTITQPGEIIRETVTNDRIYGNIQITKVDAVDGTTPLSGAVFTLYQKGSDQPYQQDGLTNPAMTGSNGLAIFANLPAGDYVVKETQVPEGYEADANASNGIGLTVVTKGETVQAHVKNKRILGSIEITKVDAANQTTTLRGAEFTLYAQGAEEPYQQDGLTNPAITNENGIAVFADLPIGSYVVRETKAPAGYEIQSGDGIEAVIAAQGDTVQERVENTRIYGGIEITKVDAADQTALLSGAEFTLYEQGASEPYQQEGLANPVVTEQNGVARFANLPAGRYEVKETRAPAGYVVSADSANGIEAVITAQGDLVQSRAENTRIYGGIQITKVDAADHTTPLQGAEFTLYVQGSEQAYQQEGLANPAVTGSDGVAVFANLPAGSYVVRETKAPAGYEISTDAATGIEMVIVRQGDLVTQRVENARIYGSIQITKVDAANQNNTLRGAEFTLYAQDSDQPYQQDGLTNPAVTGGDGIVTFANLPAGRYIVKETKAPTGYTVSAEGTNGIEAVISQQGATVTQQIGNARIYGGIQITKVDAADTSVRLSGAEFTLYAQGSDQPYQQAGLANPVVTGSNGIAFFANLPTGAYVVKETKAPAGYEISAVAAGGIELSVTSQGEVSRTRVENTRIYGNIQITKVDAADQTAPLSGAEFTLYQQGSEEPYQQEGLMNPVETGSDGVALFANLPAGDYLVKETRAPAGYTASAEAARGIVATVAQQGETLYTRVENARIYGGIQITKVDAADQTTPLSGAEFTLYAQGSDQPYQQDGLTNPAVTGSDGVAVFANLPAGVYLVKETKAPAGYAISAEASNGLELTVANAEETTSARVENARIYGSIRVTKVDAADQTTPLSGAEFTLYAQGSEQPYQRDGLTNPVITGDDGVAVFANLPVGRYVVKETKAPAGYAVSASAAQGVEAVIAVQGDIATARVENARIYGGIEITKVDAADQTPLAGAEFTLYAQGSDQPYQRDGLTNPAISGSDGVAVFANLPAGDYVVRETKAPTGYRLGDTPWEQQVTIASPSQVYQYTCENQRIVGRLILTKMSQMDVEGRQVLLPGARFELLAADQQTVVAPEQETNQMGQITFENLRFGTYYLRETAAPAGYDLSTALREVQITGEREVVYVNLENQRTVTPEPPTPPDEDTDEEVPDNGGGDDEEGEVPPIDVVDPSDLTPDEVETLIEDGFVPLSDRPDLTPEEIIDEQIPLANIPDEEVPLAAAEGIPQTGDNTPVGLFGLLLAASLSGLFVLYRKPKYKK